MLVGKGTFLTRFHHCTKGGVIMRSITNAVPIPELAGWLLLDFDNGERRLVDVKPAMKGILEKLKSAEFFNQVSIDEELGTVTWPGELDLDPDNLYHQSIEINEFMKLAEVLRDDNSSWLERA